jgi:hypothetical protein
MSKSYVYTFRTEGPFDGERERTEGLIRELDLKVLRRWTEPDGVNSSWMLDFFKIETDIGDVEVLRRKMEELIYGDRRFIDLHRCSQTLRYAD